MTRPPHLRVVSSTEVPSGELPALSSGETEAVTVYPGQIVNVWSRFPGSPQRVLFSYVAPGAGAAVHDPGAGEPGSRINVIGDKYHYAINTRGMNGGVGEWYFVSEDQDLRKCRAKAGEFHVRKVSRALLDRDVPVEARVPDRFANRFDMLGARSVGGGVEEKIQFPVGKVAAGVAVGFAAALLLFKTSLFRRLGV
jgi:hypothetical protein